MKKIALFGLFGAVGCLAGWLLGEPLLAIGLPEAAATGTPSLVSRSNNPAPPPEFKERLEKTNARTGDVQISLIWDGRHDLDLHCIAGGEDIGYNHRLSLSGGQLDVDSNAGCEKDIRDKPVENIFWPPGKAPEGEYQVYVDFYTSCPRDVRTDPSRNDFATPFKVRILSNGEERVISKTATYTGRGANKVLVENFRVGPKIQIDAPAEATARSGKTLDLPFRLIRTSVPGQAIVSAAKLPAGVKASAVVVPVGETDGKITLVLDKAEAGTNGIELSVNADGRTASAPVSLTVIPGSSWSWRIILILAAWTALLAAGLTAALVIGQNRYLGRPWMSGKLPLAALGAAGAGAISGAVGQTLLFLFALVSFGGVGFFVGWLLLGALLGFGVSSFIPNLDRRKATLAGLVGGGVGAAAFLMAAPFADWAGRVVGAAILGYFIGLMVALVEAAFRRAWLEVRFSGGETITVNLGPEPVKVGDDRSCTVWARGAAAVALRYWIRDGRVICDDMGGGGERPVGNGDQRQAGAVGVTVRTGSGVASPIAPPTVQVPPRPLPPKPVSVPPPSLPPPVAAKPVAAVAAAKPVAPSVAVAKPASPPPAPPKPVTAPTPLQPTAPAKPAATVSAGGGCPGCGRSAAGPTGKRYCMVCDQYF